MLRVWWGAIRPKTLPASLSPILLGSTLAFSAGEFHWAIFALAALCALALQIAVNLANDLADAKSGVDTDERIGPKRVTQSGLISPKEVKTGLFVFCLLAVFSGLGLVWLSHWALLIFGVLSVLGVFAYSSGPYPLASHGLGEVTVLLFFGFLAVGGTYFAHAQSLSWSVLGYGAAVGLISAAIMLVNNIRDIPTDTAAGKRTLAVRLGSERSRQLYTALLVGFLGLHLIVSFGLGLWSFLPMLIVAPLVRSLIKRMSQSDGAELNALLGKTAQLVLVYSLLMSGLLFFIYF